MTTVSALSSDRKGRIERAYEWFLELPVPIVLAVMWLTGIVLIALCALALYLCWSLLLQVTGT